MERTIRENPKLWAVVIYLFLVSGFLYLRPSVAFGEEGRIRPFGVSNKQSTVFPVWWWIFILALASYFIVLFLARFEF